MTKTVEEIIKEVIPLKEETMRVTDPLLAIKLKLNEIIERRKEVARKKGIQLKAQEVATVLGTPHHNGPYTTYVFEDPEDGIKIVFDSWTGVAKVFVDNKIVFEGDNQQINKYVPGPWEDILEQLYDVAEKKKWVKETEEMIEEIKKECEDWGVDPELLTDDLSI